MQDETNISVSHKSIILTLNSFDLIRDSVDLNKISTLYESRYLLIGHKQQNDYLR